MCRIRWMIRRDLEESLIIERLCYELPWTEEEFIKTLRSRDAIGMVVEREGEVIGYVVYGLRKDHLELYNVAVHPFYQSRGVGKFILDKIKTKLSSHRRTRIQCYVREWNEQAQFFFKSQGFLCTKIEHEMYEDSDDDAYKFEFFHVEEQREAAGNVTARAI